MARKRPKLIPTFDDVLAGTVFNGSANHWEDLRTALRESGQALHLLDVRRWAGRDPFISAPRVFDVCA
jgi:hypothetical protein